jgi:hypothetical protein
MVLEEILLIGQSQTRTFHGGHVYFAQVKRFQRRTFLLIDKQETRIRFIWLNGFRGEEFLEIDQPETRIAYGDHICYQIGTH